MLTNDFSADLKKLNDFISRGVISVDNAASFINVSRQVIYRWRKLPTPNIKAKNAHKLSEFLNYVQRHALVLHPPFDDANSDVCQVSLGQRSNVDQMVQDIKRLPPILQITLRQHLDALLLLSIRLQEAEATA